ncbi:hypothetical protein [Spirochaeta cellobiosiphila]|uniref:hypothetical protein n=1 Tax=Spirochaeta cellobiosiphila TaxID=504483 RepID=UPI0003FDF59C|nr:hypothetical protein [Spirochaeta cellobiosiphila]
MKNYFTKIYLESQIKRELGEYLDKGYDGVLHYGVEGDKQGPIIQMHIRMEEQICNTIVQQENLIKSTYTLGI